MPENNPTPWPPAPPEAGKREPIKPLAKTKVGWTSLILAVSQLALFLLAVVLYNFDIVVANGYQWYIDLFPLHVVWWLCAVIFGLVGWRSVAGKAGLFTALVYAGIIVYGMFALTKALTM